jgi:hypothetical protein
VPFSVPRFLGDGMFFKNFLPPRRGGTIRMNRPFFAILAGLIFYFAAKVS